MSAIYALCPKWVFAGAGGFLLVVCLVLGVRVALLGGKVSSLEGKLASANQKLATCQSNRATLEASITVQNEAVKRLGDEAAERSRVAAKAVRDARAQTVSANRRVAQVLAAKPGDDPCHSADELILGSVR